MYVEDSIMHAFVGNHSILYFITITICLASCQSFMAPGTILSRNYVIPSGHRSMCYSNQDPCLTLEEYASHVNTYFVNNTVFYFYPGTHRLDISLRLSNITNITMTRLSDGEMVSIMFDVSASVTWTYCSKIEITSMVINLSSNFTYAFVFEFTQVVILSNISVFGNGNTGCSSIKSQASAI